MKDLLALTNFNHDSWSSAFSDLRRSPKTKAPKNGDSTPVFCEFPDLKGINRGFLSHRGTPKPSILIGSSIINHPAIGVAIFIETTISLWFWRLCVIVVLRVAL